MRTACSENEQLASYYKRAGWWLAVTACCALAVGTPILLLANPNNLMVHPDNPTSHMLRLLTGGTGFASADLLSPFIEYDHRARFLSYLSLLIDYRLRVFLYRPILVFPTFSVTWLFTLFASPYLLFCVCRKLHFRKYSSLFAAMIYLSSTAFLSGFSMFFMPGKPLSMFMALLIAYLAIDLVEAERSATPSSSLLRKRLQIAGLVFFGLFLDEMFFVVLAMVPIVCLSVISASEQTSQRWRGARVIYDTAVIGIPLVIFFVLVVWVAPQFTLHFHGYRLDYIGALSDTVRLGTSRPAYQFSASLLFQMASTLFGMSLVPHQLAPIVPLPDSGVETVQVMNGYQFAILLTAAVGLLYILLRSERSKRLVMLGLVVSVIVTIILISAMQGRHVPVVTGYYYGCIFAVPFTLTVAATLDSLMAASKDSAKWLGVALTIAIVAIQLDNFWEINRSFVDYHNVHRDATGVSFRSIREQPLSWTELHRIHDEWKRGTLDEYLKTATVSDGAWYLITELRGVDRLSGDTSNNIIP
jgi:hypothetical protein